MEGNDPAVCGNKSQGVQIIPNPFFFKNKMKPGLSVLQLGGGHQSLCNCFATGDRDLSQFSEMNRGKMETVGGFLGHHFIMCFCSLKTQEHFLLSGI